MEQFLRLGRIGIAGGDITGPPWRDLIFDLDAVGFLESLDHIEHAVADAGSEIEDFRAGMFSGIIERRHMTFGQVDHVNEIPHARAVMGGIIVAEHAQMIADADHRLGEIRQQVVRNAVGTFADEPAFMRADRVEITEQDDGHNGIRLRHAEQDLFDHVFGPAVGIGAVPGRRGLLERRFAVGPVNRGGRAEDQFPALMGAHDFQHGQHGVEVVPVIFDRFGDGFADRLESGKVDDAFDRKFVEHGVEPGFVGYIQLAECGAFPRDLLDLVDDFRFAVRQVVGDDHILFCIDEFDCSMGSDETGSAGQKNSHDMILSVLKFQYDNILPPPFFLI